MWCRVSLGKRVIWINYSKLKLCQFIHPIKQNLWNVLQIFRAYLLIIVTSVDAIFCIKKMILCLQWLKIFIFYSSTKMYNKTLLNATINWLFIFITLPCPVKFYWSLQSMNTLQYLTSKDQILNKNFLHFLYLSLTISWSPHWLRLSNLLH